MQLEEAFAPGVSPAVFFDQKLPALVEPYLERFAQLSEVEVVLAVRLLGEPDAEWTVTCSDESFDVEEGEGFDEPLVTITASGSDWELFRAQTMLWAQSIQASFDTQLEAGVSPQFRLTQERLKALQRISGTLQLSVHGVPGESEPMVTRYLFNTFLDEGARVLEIDAQYEDLVAFIREGATFDELYSTGKLKMRGNMSLPMKIAGVFMAY